MTECTNCKGTNLKWWVDLRMAANSAIMDGRLKLEDIEPIAYLGCEECGETLTILTGWELAAILNGGSVKGWEAIRVVNVS